MKKVNVEDAIGMELCHDITAIRSGKSVLLVDRNEKLGGVLLQCTHKGFGLGWFEEDLTGMEYASRFEQLFQKENRNTSFSENPERKAEIALNTTVTEIRKNKTAVLFGKETGKTVSRPFTFL